MISAPEKSSYPEQIFSRRTEKLFSKNNLLFFIVPYFTERINPYPTNHYKYLIFGFNDVREMVDQFAGFFQLFFGKLRKAFSCDRLFELVNRVLDIFVVNPGVAGVDFFSTVDFFIELAQPFQLLFVENAGIVQERLHEFHAFFL